MPGGIWRRRAPKRSVPWRASVKTTWLIHSCAKAEADAFYAPPLSPVRGSAGGTGRFIGQQTSLALTWSASEHLTIGGTYVHYTPGERLKQAEARSGAFLAGWAQLIF